MTPYKKYIAFKTIVLKEVGRFLRIWTQTLLPSAVTMALYFVIFGAFIGSQVADIEGYTYMQFIVPGLIMMGVITNSYSNVVSSFFGTKFMHNIDELMVSPTPHWVIIAGYMIGGVARGMLVGLIVTLVSLFFVPLQVFSYSMVILFVTLTSIVFALGGLTNAVFAKKFDDVTIVPTFVLTPLTYLGGVFYSIEALPEFWQNVSKLNPIVYMIDGFRYGFLGVHDISLWVGLTMLSVFAVALFAVNLWLLHKGIGMKK
jgi:ABC-2 type transport system permease protein